MTFSCEECGYDIEPDEEYTGEDGACLCFSCYYNQSDNLDDFFLDDY